MSYILVLLLVFAGALMGCVALNGADNTTTTAEPNSTINSSSPTTKSVASDSEYSHTTEYHSTSSSTKQSNSQPGLKHRSSQRKFIHNNHRNSS